MNKIDELINKWELQGMFSTPKIANQARAQIKDLVQQAVEEERKHWDNSCANCKHFRKEKKECDLMWIEGYKNEVKLGTGFYCSNHSKQ